MKRVLQHCIAILILCGEKDNIENAVLARKEL
jgi:hypothetical protein